MNGKTQATTNTASSSRTVKMPFLQRRLDMLIIMSVCMLLIYGAFWQIFRTGTDAAKYDCYAVAFWQGVPALNTLPAAQCHFISKPALATISQADIIHFMRQEGFPAPLVTFVASQSSTRPLQALPHEYPILTVIPFSLGLLVPSYWYQVAFAVWMALLVMVMYIVLKRCASTQTARMFALYLVIGGWATVVGRFDLVPAALTLFALLYADRARWNWAFAMLALATLFKFYPVVLVLPLFIAQQTTSPDTWYARRRWEPLGVFVGVSVAIVALSLALNVEGTLGPLSYFQNRPIQVESFSSSLVWLLSFFSSAFQPLHFTFSYGSLNVISPLSNTVSLLDSVMVVVGIVYTCWLQWRGKLKLATSSLLVLLIVMLTGKVFSPQYLIWVIPLAAYAGGNDRRWHVCWVLVGLLTTCIYPFIYSMSHILQVPFSWQFYPFVTLRNFILLGFTLWLLFFHPTRRIVTKGSLPQPTSEDAKTVVV